MPPMIVISVQASTSGTHQDLSINWFSRNLLALAGVAALRIVIFD